MTSMSFADRQEARPNLGTVPGLAGVQAGAPDSVSSQPPELPLTTFKRLRLERLAVTGTVQQARSEVARRRAKFELLVLRFILAGLLILAIAAVAAPRWFR